MSTKNGRTLSLRLDQHETERLAKFEAGTGVDGVTLGRNALKSCLDHFFSGGQISFPFRLVPASAALKDDLALAAEDPPPELRRKQNRAS